MKRTDRAAALLLALLVTSLAGAAEPRIGKFVRYDVGDITLLTSRGAKQARSFTGDLAKFRVALEKTLARKSTNTGVPTHIFIVGNADWRKYLQPREGVAGWFQAARFGNYMVIDGDVQDEFALGIFFHEYTHFFLRSQFAGEYPPWFNEGLAEVMAYAKFTSDNRAILQLPMFRVAEARDGDWIPFDRLIRVDHSSPEYVTHKLAASFYSQAWLTVHYGLIENRDFGRQMINYLRQLNSLKSHDDAVRDTFGPDLAATDKLLRDYSRSKRMGSGGINLGEVPPFELGVGTPMMDTDAMAAIADLMFETRIGRERIRPLVESLGRREPAKARSAILRARLALLDDDNAAFNSAMGAAETRLTAGDLESRRELALVYMRAVEREELSKRSKEDTDADLKRSMRWFSEVLQSNPDDVEALWGFGVSCVRLRKHLDVAQMTLENAYQQAPTNASIAMALANLHGANQDSEKVIPYLKDAIRFSDDISTKQWATRRLAQLEEFLAEKKKSEEDHKRKIEEYQKKNEKPKKKPG